MNRVRGTSGCPRYSLRKASGCLAGRGFNYTARYCKILGISYSLSMLPIKISDYAMLVCRMPRIAIDDRGMRSQMRWTARLINPRFASHTFDNYCTATSTHEVTTLWSCKANNLLGSLSDSPLSLDAEAPVEGN